MTFTLPDWPMFGLAEDVRPTLRAAIEAKEACALVTLFAVEGGGPRPPGTQMVFAGDAVSGFLSGGCVEGDVAIHAAAALAASAECRHRLARLRFRRRSVRVGRARLRARPPAGGRRAGRAGTGAEARQDLLSVDHDVC